MKILRAVAIVLAACGTPAAAAGKNEPPTMGTRCPTFEETCFQARAVSSFLPMTDAQRMLESIGQDSHLYPGDRDKVRLKGLFRIRDWTPESVVLVDVTEPSNHLRFHVWGDGQGVSLFLTPAGAAYRITQQPGEGAWKQDFRTCLSSLLATDDRRGYRLPAGAWQVRCQDRAVVVTKGSVRVMTVPLEGPAKNLYVEAPYDATLHDLAILHSGSVPEEIATVHRVVLDGRQPARLSWKGTLPKGAHFRRQDDGCVELAVEKTTEVASANVAMARPGLFEVIIQIDDVTPGTGIALLNAKGAPLDGIEFGREGKSQIAFGFGSPQESPALGNYDFMNRPAALSGPRQWLRLIMAAGSSKCWVSGDGIHWGRVLDWRDRYGSWQTIAIYARPTGDPSNPDTARRRLRLRSLQVRELSGLTAAVSADLRGKAARADVVMKADQGEPLQAWTERIARLVPEGSSSAAWRYACALQALAASVQIDTAEPLLHRAVSERFNDLGSTQAKIDLLQDAALVWRCRQDLVPRQFEIWDRLGREVLNAGRPAEFELYQQAAMQTSLGDPPERSGPISWELARDATTLFFAERRGADLARMMNFVTFWRASDPQVGGTPGQQLERLLQWLNVHPMRKTPKGRATVINITHAVTPHLNRAANNILSDLQSTLEGRQYADAAKILATCPLRPDDGLVSAPNDDQLFASFQTALRLLTLEHPEVCQAMVRQVGSADHLKIEQTLARGDPAAIETLLLQYCGTPSAALPCQWLGDRALAAADHAQALAWYDEGLRWAAPEEQPELAARKRLVSAMLGSAQGQPPIQPVTFADVKVPQQQFEVWIRDQLARRRIATEAASSADSLPVVAAAQPPQFQAAVFGQLHDSAVRGAKGDDLPYELQNIDWTWRRLTLLGAEDLLLAVDRSRIVAFELGGGKVRWDFGLHNGSSPVPGWPLVGGQRIYIRAAVAGDRAGVVCLESKSGRNLWARDCGGTAVCDPLWYRGRLFVVTIGPTGEEFDSPLCLVELNPETGEVISRRQILEIAGQEYARSECQAFWAGGAPGGYPLVGAGRLIMLVAGCVISTDLQGRILWLRQETTLPAAIDPAQAQQPNWRPIIESDEWLFIQQPGSCAIDCLALETGRRRWRRGVIGLQSIANLPYNRLLARTSRGLVALDKTTGEVLWQCESPNMLSAFAHTASGLILGARQATIANKLQLIFLGIDPARGGMRAHVAVPLEKSQPMFFEPLAVRGAGLGNREHEAVLVSPAGSAPGIEEIRALAQRLRQTPNPGQVPAGFDDARRTEGSLASGWRGSGVTMAHDGPAQSGVPSLSPDGPAADPARQSDTVLEMQNGDRVRGTICGFAAASTSHPPAGTGQSSGPQVLVQLPADSGKPAEKPIAIAIDWLRQIVFDAAVQPRRCPPRTLICRDGRVMTFRALRFSGEGVNLLTDRGLVRLSYRDLAEVAMPPGDAWDAYQRQLAVIDPNCDAGIVRLETVQGMVLTVSANSAGAVDSVGSTCLVQPAWSRTPIPVAGSAVRRVWRAPATVVPLSLFAPQQVTQRGALGGSWKWQADSNVAGGELRSGGVRCLWGFGVHAPNQMVFRLPDSARTFHSGLGIDAAVGDSGCVVAKVYLNEASGTPVFQSKPLRGWQPAVSTGDIALASGNSAARQLVLVVDDGGDARGPNADPLDIGDHVDWLEPTLLLDLAKLRAAVAKYRPAVK